ncbi:MAG: hypothetical protein ABIJ72_04355 [bacterium]
MNSLLQLRAFLKVSENSYLEAFCEGEELVVRGEGLDLYTRADALRILKHDKLCDEKIISGHVVSDQWGEQYGVIIIDSCGGPLPDRVVFETLDHKSPKRGLRAWVRELLHNWLS